MNKRALIDAYLNGLTDTLAALDRDALEAALRIVDRARRRGRTVFVIGNGGSATTAAHLACDLGKNTRSEGREPLATLCLAAELGTFSAYANDDGYGSVFVEPLRALAKPGDVVVAISASGRSENVIRALELARERGLHAIGLTGRSGGELASLVDVSIHAQTDSIEQVEDAHLVVNHLLTVLLRG